MGDRGCVAVVQPVPETKLVPMSADLRPHESMVLTMALAQLHRGDEVSQNIAAVCIFALGRLTGRVEYDAEEATYRVFPPDAPFDVAGAVRDLGHKAAIERDL